MVKLETFTQEDADSKDLFKNTSVEEEIDARDLQFDDKVLFFKTCLNEEGLYHPQILSNIVLLAQGCSLKDEVFEDTKVYFTSLEEYIDVKYTLKEEVDEYVSRLVRYFMGCLKSLSIELPDGKENIPYVYRNVLMSLSLYDMSKLMNKTKYQYDNIPLVYNSDAIINAMTFKEPIYDELAQELLKNLKEQ